MSAETGLKTRMTARSMPGKLLKEGQLKVVVVVRNCGRGVLTWRFRLFYVSSFSNEFGQNFLPLRNGCHESSLISNLRWWCIKPCLLHDLLFSGLRLRYDFVLRASIEMSILLIEFDFNRPQSRTFQGTRKTMAGCERIFVQLDLLSPDAFNTALSGFQRADWPILSWK